MDFWNFFAIFGVDPNMCDCTKMVILCLGFALALGQFITSFFTRDRSTSLSSSEWTSTLQTFYGITIVAPVIILVSLLELIFIIIASVTTSTFIIAIMVVLIWLISKMVKVDPSERKISAYGLVAYIQKRSYQIICVDGHRYPGSRLFERLRAINKINKQQKREL